MVKRGWFIRNEIEASIGDSRQAVYLGFDHGRVSGPSTEFLAGESLTGMVLGLRGTRFGFSYEVFAGWALAKPEGYETAQPALGMHLAYQF
jgi:hemolysin activation/secretion protein